MDDKFQDVRVPGNTGSSDTTQQSASVSFGQVIPTSVPNPTVAQPISGMSQSAAPTATPVGQPAAPAFPATLTPAVPVPPVAAIPTPPVAPIQPSSGASQPGFTQTPVTPPVSKPVVPRGPKLNVNWKKVAKYGGAALLLLLVLAGITAAVLNFIAKRNDGQVLTSSKFNTVQIPLEDLGTQDDVSLLGTRSLLVNGPLRANSAFIISPSAQPSNAARGQIYYDQNNNQLAYYNGTRFVPVNDNTNVVQSIGGFNGTLTLGQGLNGANGQISNTGVLTVQGQSGNVTFVGGPGIAVDGTTITNSGVTSFGGQTGDITIGQGLTITPDGELQNSGVVSATGGTGITVTNDGSGNITISNTGAGTGTIQSPGGTPGRIAKFTGVQTIEDSLLSEAGTTVTVNGNLSVTGSATLANALTVGNGGTGTTSLAANGVVIGQGAGALTAVTAGGPGLCLISTAGAPSFQACPGGASVTSVNGLVGALTIANATGAGTTITINDASTSQKGIAQFNATNFTAASGVINTAQNINVAATPTFGTLTLTSSQATSPMLLVNNTNAGATGNLVDIRLNGTTQLALSPAGNMTLTGTINGQTISSNANFTGSLAVATTLTTGGNITASGDVAVNGGDITSTGALNITPGGALTVGATSQTLTLQGNGSSTLSATSAGNTTTLSFQTPTANVNYRLLTAAAGTYDICTTAGNCVGVGGSVSTPGGTTNQLAKFTGSNTIGNSIISDNGTTVSIAGALAVNTITPTGALTIGAIAQNLTLQGASTTITSTTGGITNSLVFAAPSGSNKTITIPNASGTVAVSASGPLAIDANGNLTCATCATTSGIVTSLNGLTGALSIANASAAGSTITIQDASTGQKGIAQFNSTNFSVSGGTVNTIQNINVAATPTFGALTLTSSQATSPMLLVNNTNGGATGNLIDLQLNGASRLAVTPAGNMTLTGTLNGQTISSAANLTGSLTVAADTTVGGALNVTGAANLNGGAAVTGTLNANTITPTAAMTVGATNQTISLQGNATSTFSATSGANTTTLAFQTPTANVTYRLLTAAAGTYDICTTAGNCVGVGGGVTTTGGTTNQLAKFSGANSIVDSIISDNGTTVSIGGTLAVNTITPTGALTIGATGQNLLLQGATTSLTSTNGGVTNSLTFATPTGGNKTITIPNATGTVAVSASGPIVLDANGNISCPTCSLSGSGVISLNGLTGALSIANATGAGSTITIQDASTSQKGIAQFNNTNFSASGGVINTIQNISVAATPTFGALTLTSSQATSPMLLVNNTNASGTGNLIDLQLNGASRMNISPAGNMTLTGTLNGQTISSAANFTGTLAVTGATTLSNTLSVTGAASLNGGASVTGTLTANTITPTGALTVGATGQSLTLQGNASSTFTATSGANTTTLAFQTPTANVTYRLLTAAAGTYDICTTAGNCTGVGGGVTTSGGTPNAIPKFTGAQTIGDSIISDNGSTVTIGGVLAVNTITPTGALTIGATGQNLLLQGATTSLTATNAGITNALTFATPSGSNKTITVPNASGTVAVSASGPITLDVNGNISCPTCALAGSGVTSLNGLTGALSIANATGAGSTITIQDASTAQKGLAQFNATNFSVTGGVVNTIQDIAVSSAPTFGRLTVTSSQASNGMLLVNNTNAGATGNLLDLQLNSVSRLSVNPAGNLTLTGTVNGQTISSAASLTGTLAVAGAASLNGGATVTGTLTANTITPTGALTIGATGQSFLMQGNASSSITATSGASTTTVSFQTPTANVTYRLLTAAAGTYDICTTAGNCTGVGGGVTTPGGTAGTIAKFTGTGSIADSIITESGSTITIGGTLAVNTITPAAAMTIGATGQNLTLQGADTTITETNGGVTNSLVFQTPSGGNKTITIPNASGTVAVSASGPLSIDANGNISCPTCATSGGGGGVTVVDSLNGLTGALTLANATAAGSTVTIDDASTSQKGIAQFNATNFTASGGVVNTIQDINTSAAPTFGRLTVQSSQASNAMLLINNTNASGTGNLIDLQLNGSSRMSVSPAGAMTLVGNLNGQTISSAANFTGTLTVANALGAGSLNVTGAANLNGGATVTGTLTANTITPTGALTVGATNQSFLLQGATGSTITATSGANTTTVAFQTPTANVTYRFLTAAAGTYDICTTAGNCAGVGGGVTTSGGTTNQLAKFTGSSTIGDSIISDNGTTVTIGGALAVNTLTPTSALSIGATGQNLTLQGATVNLTSTNGSTVNSLTFATPTGSNKTITIPDASGTLVVSASGPLAIDAAGNITCATCLSSGGAVTSLNGLTGALTLANATAAGSTVTINDASTSQKGIAQFNATNFSASAGVINTIQNINTGAAPTFGQLTLSSSQASAAMLTVNNTNVAASGNLIDLQLNGSSRMSVSPAGNMTVTGTVNGQTISSAASFTGTLAVAGAANLNGGATVTGTLTANTISPTSALTVGATNQNFTLQGAASSTITATNAGSTTSLAFQTPTANVTYRLLTTTAGTYDICTTAGNCVGVGGGVTTSGGTAGRIVKFTGSNAVGDSIMSEAGSVITVTGTLAATTALQTPTLDTASASALNIGTTNATSINLNQNTTVAGDLDVTGGFLTVGTFQVAQTGDIVTGGDADVQGGSLNLGTTSQAGTATLSDGSSNTLLLQTAALGTNRTVTFSDETGTVCLQNSAACGFAASSGSANYIQNQNSTDQTANFRISGTGRANTSLLTPLLDTATAGTLTLGGTATAISLTENTTITGGLTQSTGALSLQANNTSVISTSSGALTITAGATSVWSTSGGDLSIRAATGQTLRLENVGQNTASIVSLGDNFSQQILIGRGSNIARTINIGDTGGGSQAQTVTVGNSGTTSTTAIKGGGGVTINAGTGNWSLQGASTSTLAGTSGSFTTTFGFTTPTANTTINLPALTAGTYTVCTSSGNCAGAGVTLQGAYNNSTNPELTLDATRGALTIRDASSALGANLLEVQNNAGSTTYFAVTATGTSTTGTATATGNINSSGGALQTNGTTRIDNSGNASNIGNITLSGAISGGTTYTGSGNINTTGGAIQTNSTTRVDNSGNLVNIGNITGTGAITIASSGAGNDVIVNGADAFIVQDASQFTSTLQVDGAANMFSDVTLALADTENLEITSTVTGTNAVTLGYIGLVNNTSSGTQNGALIQNIGGTGTTENLLSLDNADADTAVPNGLTITAAAGGIQNAIDVSDVEIINALLFGSNDIVGANLNIAGGTGNLTTSGDIAVNGGDITSSATTLTVTSGSYINFDNNVGFIFKNGGNNRAYINGQNGRLEVYAANSFGGLTINGSTGTSAFTVSGDSSEVTIGYSNNVATLLVLDTKNDAGDPTAFNGSMYYNSAAGKFRCYEAGAWKDCIAASSGTLSLQGAYDGGNTITTTDSRNIAISLADTATDSNFFVDLQCDTSCGNNGRFAVQDDGVDVFAISPANGSVLFRPSANALDSFNMENAAGGNLFTIDAINSRVGINLGSNWTPSMSGSGLEVNGAISLIGTGLTQYTTPGGANINTRFGISASDPGAFSQLFALGLTSTAQSTARGLSLFDARTGSHQQTLAVFSPDENGAIGFTWNGSNTTAQLTTLDENSSSDGMIIRSGNVASNGGSGSLQVNTGDQTGGDGSTGAIYIVTGSGGTGNTTTGNVVIDSGVKSGSGTNGTISLAASNASALLLGRTGLTTSNVGGLAVTQSFSVGDNVTLGSDNTDTVAVNGVIQGGAPLVFEGSTADAYELTLSIAALTADHTITMPNESGTVCLQGSTACAFAPGSGSANYIQNTTTQQTANMNIISAAAGNVGAYIEGAANMSAQALVVRSGSNPTANAFEVQSSTGGQIFAVDAASTRVIVGNGNSCTGRICIGQSVSGGGGGTVTNMYNINSINTSAGSTTIGHNIVMNDISTAITNRLRPFIIDTSGTTNASATIDSIFVKLPASATGTALQIQNGSTDTLTIGNSGSAAFKTIADSVTALTVQGTAAVNVLTADTFNNTVRLRTAFSDNVSTFNAIWLQAPKNAVTAMIGGDDDTSGYTANESSGNLRWNGSNVGWGDLGYYPQGGDTGENGHFRFSTTGSAINTTPNAKVGVGDLYVANNAGIGTNNPSYKLHVVGSAYASTSVLAPLLDTASAGALAIGTTNATGINLNQNTVIAATKTLTVTSGATSLTGATTGDALTVSNNTSTGNIAVFRDNATTVATIADGGAATFQNSTNSGSAFRVLNSTGGELVGVDSNNSVISMLANNTGHISTFTNTSALNSARWGNGNAYLNGYIYVIGGSSSSGCAASNTVQYAKVNADGTIGTWATTGNTTLVADCGVSATAYNGYLYAMMAGNLYYTKPNADGTITSAWTQSSVAMFDGGSNPYITTYNGYLYELNSNSPWVYYYRINADGSIGAQNAQNVFGATSQAYAAYAIANGYLYTLGGAGGASTGTYYTKINADGSLGTTTSGTALPLARQYGGAAVANGYIYYLGGENASGVVTTTYYAPLSSTGAIGSWTDDTASPSPDRGAFDDPLVINGYIYLTGGWGSPNSVRSEVSYASTTRLRIGGGLDLLAYSGENLADGGSGGQLSAGNTVIAGTLNVSGSGTFSQGLGVAGALNAGTVGTTALTVTGTSTNTFSVVNASGVTLISADTTNSRVYIGNPTADSTGALLVLDTKNTTGDPTGVLGGMYYNSALQQFRCFRAVSATPGDGLWEACGTEPIDRGWSVSDEFLGGSWDSGVVGELGWTNDLQSGAPQLDYGQGMGFASANRPGIIEINTSNTLNAGVTLTLDRDSVGSVTLAPGNVVKTTAGMDSTLANTVFRTGLHNQGANNTRPTAGVWWEAAPTVNSRWQFCYGSGGVATCSTASNTTPTIAATTWYRLEIRIIATGSGTSQIDYYIDGQKFSVTGATLTTTTLVRPAMACWNSTSAQRFCNIDYYQFSGTASAAR